MLRRQLRLLRGGAGPGAHRLPAGGDARGRLVGHHQAPGDGRHGDGRDGDRAAALRDRRPALPQPRRRGPLRQHRARPGGRRPGAHRGRPGRAAAGHAQGDGQSRCRLAQRHDAGVDRRPGGREGPVRRRGGVGRHPGRARRLRRDRGGPLGRPHRWRHGVPAPRRARRRRAGGRPGLLGRRRRDEPVELSRHLLHLGAVGGAGRGPLLADDGRAPPRWRRGSSATASRSRPRPRTAGTTTRLPPTSPTDAAAGDRRTTAGDGDLVRVPLWALVGARSGDKGGDANVGVWADDDAVAAWLADATSPPTSSRRSCPRSSPSRSAGTRCRTCGR